MAGCALRRGDFPTLREAAGGSETRVAEQHLSGRVEQAPHRYRLCAEDIADSAVIIYKTDLTVRTDLEDVLPDVVDQKMGCKAWEVEAVGDGACALHALVGAPEERGKLFCREARAFARRHLSMPLSDLKRSVGPSI